VRTNGLAAVERRVEEPSDRAGVVDPDAPHQPSGEGNPAHPVVAFCAHPQGRIDDAVNQGLSILAGLALGSSVNDRSSGRL